jgi:hypothetical protein
MAFVTEKPINLPFSQNITKSGGVTAEYTAMETSQQSYQHHIKPGIRMDWFTGMETFQL